MQFVKKLFLGCTVVLISVAMNAQNTVGSSSAAVVPRLVNFSGKVTNDQGRPITAIVGITFSIYNAQEGGTPLWMETQNVQPDGRGNYTAQLGAATSDGLPADLFKSGEARWLGVRVNGSEEQPRVLLLSVPYALKAADAQTLGGLPASAFALAATSGPATPTPTQPAPSASSSSAANIGGTGTQDYIPLWTDNNGDLGNSILYQSGTGSSAKIGINEKSPLFTLDVNGQELVRGLFEMATTNYASKTKGYNSQPLNFESSAFNSTAGTYTLNHFQWQAEPTGNNTATPGATLNLLYGTDPNQPAETGLNIASSGQITFAKGQTFPGTGTITGVTTATGSGLSGGGTSGNLGLSLVNTCAKNQVLQWSGSAWACSSAGTGTITGVTAGTGLSGGGTGGDVTLSVSGVPLLAGNNAFTGSNSFNGTLGVQNISSVNGIGFYTGGVQQMTIEGAYANPTVVAYGINAPAGSGEWGGSGVFGFGGYGDSDSTTNGGDGLVGLGNAGGGNGADGVGVQSSGGNGMRYGDGILSVGGTGYAGDFNGDVNTSGAYLVNGMSGLNIDHPLDPANKYLAHASVESSEMKNMYDGVVTTDAQGQARVQLPEWFEALNKDFRYQLTVIGQFAQAIVSREIENHEFAIRTSAPNVKVSWQVTGVRQDAYAKAHPLVVEEEKEARLRGYYTHPELYGAAPEKQIEWARHPEAMKRMQEYRQRMKEKQPRPTQSAALPHGSTK